MIYCKSLNLALNAFCVNVSVCELSSRYIYVAENVTIASERHIPRYRSFQCRGTITRIKVIHAHISGKLCVLINWKANSNDTNIKKKLFWFLLEIFFNIGSFYCLKKSTYLTTSKFIFMWRYLYSHKVTSVWSSIKSNSKCMIWRYKLQKDLCKRDYKMSIFFSFH